MLKEIIICNRCGKVHRNILTSDGKVQCVRCHKWIKE